MHPLGIDSTLLLISTVLGLVYSQPYLTPPSILVNENNPATLTCTYTGTGTVKVFVWRKDDKLEGNMIPPECDVFKETPDDTKYTYSCVGNKQMSWTIRNINRSNEGDNWTCGVYVEDASGYEFSDIVSISVRVPIQSVSMILPSSDATINVTENTEKTFRCRTDGGLPVAEITWYKDNGTPGTTGDDTRIQQYVTVTKTSENGLDIRASTLRLYPSRYDGNNRIYCSAKNSDNQTPWISLRKPQLNVLFGPDDPPTLEGYTNGGTYKVTENKTGTLKCSSTGGNPLATLSWKCYSGQTSGDETTNTTVVATKTWIATRNTNRACSCTSSHTVVASRTVTVNVQVLYPPDTPKLYVRSKPVIGTVKVIRGETLSIQCDSSGQPTPVYTWIYPNKTSHNGKELVLRNIQTSSNGQYTCKAENHPYLDTGNTIASASSQVTVEVLFAPSTPTIHYDTIAGSSITVDPFNVVAGDHLAVACIADGNPEPNYTWQFDNAQYTGQRIVLSSFDRYTVDTTIECTAQNELQETGSTVIPKSNTTPVTMNIMYPPDIPNIRLKYGSGTYTDVSNVFSVLLGAAFVLDCQGSSKPSPSYQWYGSSAQSASEIHVPASTTTRDGVYTYLCEVTNQMSRTYGSPTNQEGKNSANVTANILYGPEVSPMFDQDAEEGKTFRYKCPYTPGNPTTTTVKWTSADGRREWNSEWLEIVNVLKNDRMRYTCMVENIMYPTNLASVTDPKSGSFDLDVKYKASIEKFIVEDHINNEVDEFTSPTLVCSVDSNPVSNIKILFQNKTLVEDASTLQLKHQLSNVSCGNIGVYTCTGGNYLNAQAPPTQDVVFLVKCRPQPFGDIAYTVYSAQHNPATISLSVLGYPDQSPSVVWKKGETDLKNNAQLTMNVNHVKSTETYIDIIQLDLTIRNVTKSDFGQYKVMISNNVGMMEKTFYLMAEDIPESPIELGLISSLIKTTEVTIQWKPGFNGGPNQTFVLLYKKISDVEWRRIYIDETGDVKMNYTLTNLESNTLYIVKIYAQNRVGNSSISDDVSIHTLDEPSGGNIGMIVGGAVGGIVLAGLVALAVFIVRRRRGGGSGDKKKLNRRTGGPPNDDDDSSEDIEIVENAAYISAGDVEQARPETQKKPVGSAAGGDIYAQVNKKDKKPVGGATGGDIYAQVKKNQKQEPKKKPKKGKGKDVIQGDIYENAPGTSNEKVYANADANTYEETQIGKTPAKKNVNKEGLIYADLTFNDQDKGNKKLVIIGDDDRTPYAQVDFTKKADPLPDSDPE